MRGIANANHCCSMPSSEGEDGIPPTSFVPITCSAQFPAVDYADHGANPRLSRGDGLASPLDSVIRPSDRLVAGPCSMRRRAFSFHARAVVWFACGFEHKTPS